MVAFLVPRMSQAMAMRAQELEDLRLKTDQLMNEANKLNQLNADQLQAAKMEIHAKVTQVLTDLTQLKEEKIHTFEAKLQQHATEIQDKLAQNKQEVLAASHDMIQHLLQNMYQTLTEQPLEAGHVSTARTSKTKGT
jgi:F-type H+-transporting ATPase subunit b